MINITTSYTSIAKDIHVKSLEVIIIKRINSSRLPNYLKNTLKKYLLNILGDSPTLLIQTNENIYKEIKRSDNKYFDKMFRSIFNYNSFIEKSENYNAYSLADNLKIDACTYCNRQYTITIKNKLQLTRPQFDHFFPKSVYPILGLSFYNLIPCCTICNSTFKGKKEMNLVDYFHPYEHDIGKEFEFSYELKEGNPRKCNQIKIEFLSTVNKDKVNRTLSMFKIKETYDGHLFIIDNLLKIKDSLNKDYLKVLTDKKIFNGISWSIDEAYELAFGASINEDEFYKHPFSKLKKDVLKKEKFLELTEK